MIGLSVESHELLPEAEKLSNGLNLPLVKRGQSGSEFDYLLQVGFDGLSLVQLGPKAPGPIRVDFESGAVAHRRRFGGGKGQQIAKACGVSSAFTPYIADLTAGLGRDSFVLATLGCRVDMVERVQVVHALLRDGLHRAQFSSDPALQEILARLSLSHLQAVEFLQTTSNQYDVIYLDPMFPHTDKSAQVKKEMLAFRSLVGADQDSAELLDAALQHDPARVVVKRPRKAPIIEGPKPSYALEGKSGRFDIYARRKLGS
ncbi:Ribosomal RNA small subunit methyltransferase J [Marinobacterium sp. xm-a-121]|uniref:class I SAM-dependent methyltransferase n=1 Tax=unclassified Marinobacterium TaxID=2644139 RepID=UPI00156918D2|nr:MULTISPECIES: class I SAM-dependent methyltransferase [unclassified Marinobacterium]NRP37796.1 Ribosomal RNA small subunit methyltransferase J [Marinobacterium sp. xm-a-121]NRP99048.1 Ribosomal RNA small subunit methyltransferase J [Marinobacterium sp. xm-v-233]